MFCDLRPLSYLELNGQIGCAQANLFNCYLVSIYIQKKLCLVSITGGITLSI